MFSRILSSTLAAGALVAATPALAGDSVKDAQTCDVPSCCEHMRMQRGHVTASQKAPRTLDRTIQDPNSDDPDVRNQSWGG